MVQVLLIYYILIIKFASDLFYVIKYSHLKSGLRLIINIYMKKKQLKYRIQAVEPSSDEPPSIRIIFQDEYFLKTIDVKKIKYPSFLLQKCNIQYYQKQISIRPKEGMLQFEDSNDEHIKQLFKNLMVYHIKFSALDQDEEQLKCKIKIFKNHDIWGFKKFYVTEGRFQKGDYLFYASKDIKQFLNSAETFFQNQSLLFELDTLYSQKKILKFRKSITQIIVKQKSSVLKSVANQIQITINQIIAKQENKMSKNKPCSSLKLLLDGNIMKIHYLYEIIENIMSTIVLQIVEVQEEQFVSEVINNLQQNFPQYIGKIFKLSNSAVLVTDKMVNLQQVKRKIRLKTWVIGTQIFNTEQIQTLNAQNKTRALRNHMANKKIFWESIVFTNSEIKLTCDKSIKNKFVEEAKNLLKTYIKQRQVCRSFDNSLVIEIFKKYYLKQFEQKFCIQFQIAENYLIRRNFTKYSQEIEVQLKAIREKIKKKLVTFVSLVPINANLNSNLYLQKQCTHGYQYQLLGCRLYTMNHLKIKMKPFQSIKKQQDCMAYVIDNRIDDDSIFHEIIKKNKISYQTFLKDAHKSKKPCRLRQYITQQCQYGSKTVLLHAGKQNVSQTLKRDLEGLFSLIQKRICIALCQHSEQFYPDVFRTVLEQLQILAYNVYQNGINPNSSSSLNASHASQNKLSFEAQFFYEGGMSALYDLQNVMKMRTLKVCKLSAFALQQFDIQKIYSLQYSKMEAFYKNKQIILSPIIAQLCAFQILRSVRKNSQTKKKFIFSMFTQYKNQLVQYIISTKTNIYYKVTHDGGNLGWSRLPHIERIQQLDKQLSQIIQIVQNYFCKTQYVVISAQSISDGLHGRKISYSKNFYLAKQDSDELTPICIDVDSQKIMTQAQRDKLQFTITFSQCKTCYEITTYKQQLENVNALIDQ